MNLTPFHGVFFFGRQGAKRLKLSYITHKNVIYPLGEGGKKGCAISDGSKWGRSRLGAAVTTRPKKLHNSQEFLAGHRHCKFFSFSTSSLTTLPLLEHLVCIKQWQETSWKLDQRECYKVVGSSRAEAGLHWNLPSVSPKKAQSQPWPNRAERNRLKFRSHRHLGHLHKILAVFRRPSFPFLLCGKVSFI